MYQEHREEVILFIRNTVRSSYVSGTQGTCHLMYLEQVRCSYVSGTQGSGHLINQEHSLLCIRNTRNSSSYVSVTQ